MRFTTQGFAGLPKWRERIEEGERVITEAGGKMVGVYVTLGTLRRRRDLRGAGRRRRDRDPDEAESLRRGAHGDAPRVHARGGGGDRAQAVSGYAFSHPGGARRRLRLQEGAACARRDGVRRERARRAARVPRASIIGTTSRTSSTSSIAAARASRSATRFTSSARAGCCTSSRRRRGSSRTRATQRISCCSSSAARTATSSATGISSIPERDLARRQAFGS